jgi:uncharacterized protein YcfJ
VGGDGLEPLLDQGAVVGGPVGRQLGEGGGAVALEPFGVDVAGGLFAGERDLEGPLAEPEREELVQGVAQGLAEEALP